MNPLAEISDKEKYKLHLEVGGRMSKKVHFRFLNRADQAFGKLIVMPEEIFDKSHWMIGKRIALKLIIDGVDASKNEVHFTLASYGGVPIANSADIWPTTICLNTFRLLNEV